MKTTPKTDDMLQRKGTKWTRWDEEKLEFLYKAGKTTEDLSEIFGRSKSSIVTRLKLMEIWSGENR